LAALACALVAGFNAAVLVGRGASLRPTSHPDRALGTVDMTMLWNSDRSPLSGMLGWHATSVNGRGLPSAVQGGVRHRYIATASSPRRDARTLPSGVILDTHEDRVAWRSGLSASVPRATVSRPRSWSSEEAALSSIIAVQHNPARSGSFSQPWAGSQGPSPRRPTLGPRSRQPARGNATEVVMPVPDRSRAGWR